MDGCQSSRTSTAEPLNPLALSLVLTLVGIFLLQFLCGPFDRFAMDYLAMNSRDFLGKGRIWQPFTAIFVHGSFFRMVVNSLLLLMCGNPLANAWRKKEFLAFSVTCGIAGSICFFLFSMMSSRGAIWCGASGVSFGLLGAYGLVYGKRRILLFFCIPMRVKVLVSACFILLFLLLVFGTGRKADQVVCLGGGICGVVLLKLIWLWQNRSPSQAATRESETSRIGGLEVMDDDEA